MSEPSAAPLPSPALRLSPLPEEKPWSPPPATPGALYRSCFAHECEAIVLQLGQRSGPGRRVSTVEAETLTPLESFWSFLSEPLPGSSEKPPPDLANRTYVREPSLCEASLQLSSGGLTFTRLQDTTEVRRRTFDLLPIEASTPLPAQKDFLPDPPEQQREEATRPPKPSLRRAPLGAHLPLSKGGPGRKSLAAAETPVLPPKAASAQGGLRKRSACSRASTAREESAGAAAAEGQMPDKRTGLAKPPSKKRAVQPPSRPSSLVSPIVGRENKSPGSKLPVHSAGGHKANQKHPLERRSVKGATAPQKQLATKMSYPGKSHNKKPACGVLLNAGQITRTTTLSKPSAPCSQCHQLAEEIRKLTEENRRLKSMLEG